MADISERRKYKRWYNPLCKVFVSEDATIWVQCEVKDISAGGLRFNGGKCFGIGQNLHFKLLIYSECSEFSMTLKAQIVHSVELSYGVKFMDITKNQQIQLDEIISAALIKNQERLNNYHRTEDGIYLFYFNPVKRKSLRVRKYL